MAKRNEYSWVKIKQKALHAAEKIVREYRYSALKVRKIITDIAYTIVSIYMVFCKYERPLICLLKVRTWQKLYHNLQTHLKTTKTAQGIFLA